MKLKGKDVVVMIQEGSEWKTFAFGTSCDLDISAETINKCADGRWKQNVKRKLSWSGNAGHLLADYGRVKPLDQLASADAVRIMFGSVEASDDSREVYDYIPDGRFGLVGNALLNRVTISARTGDFVTLSLSFVGNGELKSIEDEAEG